MTTESSLILGIIFGVCIGALYLFLFRDLIIRRMLKDAIPIDMNKPQDNLLELRQAIRHDLALDMQILLDNKKTVETILKLQVQLCDQDKQSLLTILELINTRVSQAMEEGLITDNNLEED